MFCPNCGSILLPSKDESGKRVLKCSCGHTEGSSKTKMSESVKHDKEIEVVDQEFETLPETEETCPKCGHKKAYYWEVQTRAVDEPATKFLKCAKCKKIWRDYS